jgi:hypothetical protein
MGNLCLNFIDFIASFTVVRFFHDSFSSNVIVDPRYDVLIAAINNRDEALALSLLAEFVVKGDMDVNSSWRNTTPLARASQLGLLSVVGCLLDLGADPGGTASIETDNPICFAARNGGWDARFEVLQMLIEKGKADLWETGHQGRTPLHCAAFYGRLDVTRYLVSQGCPVHLKDKQGRTALDIAKAYRKHIVAQFLYAAWLTLHKRDHRNLFVLCGRPPISLERILGYDLRYTFLLCLLETKKVQIEDNIAPSDHAAITLTSRLHDHEPGLVRHILSYIGRRTPPARRSSPRA